MRHNWPKLANLARNTRYSSFFFFFFFFFFLVFVFSVVSEIK